MARRIVIELYDHTPDEEIADVLLSIESVGLLDARLEDEHGRTADVLRTYDAVGPRLEIVWPRPVPAIVPASLRADLVAELELGEAGSVDRSAVERELEA